MIILTGALSIANLILNNAGRISLLLIITAIIIAVTIGIAEYKNQLWKYITNSRNKWWFVYDMVMLAIIIFIKTRGWLIGYWLICTSVFWLLYTIIIICSLKPKKFRNYSNLILRHYEKWLEEGSALEHIDYFRKAPHWYLNTAEDRLEFHMLACQYYDDVREFENGLKELDKIKDEWLYDSERELIRLQRAMLLVQMGSMKAAYQLLGDPEKNESNDPVVWYVYSFIYENEGNIDEALHYCEKCRDIFDAGYDATEALKASIYNNYSRVAIIKGNSQEAFRYISVAWNHAKKCKDMRYVHTVASNLIAQMAMRGKNEAECEVAFKDYKNLISNQAYPNKIEYYNCEIIYFRQIGDTKRENEKIKDGFKEIYEHLNQNHKMMYTASTYRMLMNGHFDYKWFDKYVKPEMQEYECLTLSEKLAVFKEYMGIFQQEEFRAVCNHGPYRDLQKNIMKYYHEQAISDIDKALSEVEPYNRFLYTNLMTQKLGILKLVEGKHHIQKSKDIYVCLYRELYDAGLHLDAVRVLMTLIDECTSAYNVLIWSPFFSGARYYSDILETAVQPPDPILDPDGIHLQYFPLHINPPFAVEPLYVDVIREHIDTVISEFRSWKNHPFKVELSIEIARILMCLDRRSEAGEFLQFYKDSGVSANQMASWVREDIAALEKDLHI